MQPNPCWLPLVLLAQVELCEAVADVIIVELRNLTAEERASIHELENKVYGLETTGKLSAARKVSSAVGGTWLGWVSVGERGRGGEINPATFSCSR
jgi:hypothetical protein